MRTQIFLASTLYGAATLAAALDSGAFPEADRRLLLVSNNATIPETGTALDHMPGFERLRLRFDRVLSWNETIDPFHPSNWSPRTDDVPLWERQLRRLWGLGDDDDIELIVESIQVNPALAICRLFADAPVDVYADGLMSYGPTRNKLDPLIGTRIRRLLHLDLMPGLRPLLLREFGVEPQVVPTEAFTAILAELAKTAPPEITRVIAAAAVTGDPAPEAAGGSDGADAPDASAAPAGSRPQVPALLLGQYLSALGVLTAEEEEDLHIRMLRGAVALGHHHVIFKPHPVAPARFSRALEKEAGELGAELTVLEEPVLAEVLFQRLRPALVVGCFSTALLTASTFYGLPVARTGTELLLERLSPYQNSNRVPVTLVDAALPDLDDRTAVTEFRSLDEQRVAADLTGLVETVGFTMQPQINPGLRDNAGEYLTSHLDEHIWRYFKRRRLTALALPGGVPQRLAFIPRSPAVRRAARRARALKRAVRRG